MINRSFQRLIHFSANLRRTYYDVLGIKKDASRIDVERAYAELYKKYHPSTAGRRLGAAARLREINVAYETLSDSGKRRAYDESFGGSRGAHTSESFAHSHDFRREYEERLKKIREAVEAETDKTYKRHRKLFNEVRERMGKMEEDMKHTRYSPAFVFSDATVRLVFRAYLSILGVVLFYQLFCGPLKNDAVAKDIRGKIDYFKRQAVPDVRPVNVDNTNDMETKNGPEWGFDAPEDNTRRPDES
uniref:J domain-containing protein n=1 Tax=Steinernema glaseri TaxID=37863 RepID=A0A1I7ZQI9_9BILA